jgi:hypothetical protein
VSNLWEPSGSRARTLAGLIVLAAIACGAPAGCGGGSSSSTSATTTAAGEAGATAQTAEGGEAPAAGKPSRGASGSGSGAASGGGGHRAKANGNGGGQAEGGAAGAHRRKSRANESSESGAEGQPAAPSQKPKKAANESGAEPSSGNEGSGAEGNGTPGSIGGASPVAIRKLRKHCPKNIDASSCTKLVEAFVASQGTESVPVTAPQSCTATHTEAECEVILRQQSEAAEGGESLNVQECIAHMTPQCEAALRPLFESQGAAQAGGG